MDTRIELIIVASGEAGDDLTSLLSSLAGGTLAAASISVRVVTNQCSDSTLDCLRSFPWAARADFGDNLGYGGAINRAFFSHRAPPDWIVACNADLIFPPGAMAVMRASLSSASDNVACVAPMLVDPPEAGGRVQPSVGAFPTLVGLLAGRLRPRRTRKYRPTPRASCEVDWATGACLALRGAAFQSLGGFDDAMFLDYEETDLCKRLVDGGWSARFEPAWKVIHKSPNAQRPADPARQVHTRSSLVRYLAKHRPPWEVLALSLLLRSTLAVRGSQHPFAPSWRAGLETYRRLREQPIS